ncbi:MAG: DUF3662 domain-containing protein [Pyrinomonadaceae bacterium]
MSVLEKVRRWIDGETAELVLEKAARDAQIKPRSEAEEFIVKIAHAVEAVMEREMVPLPQGTTIIPTEYLIFLSERDDKEWQGAKRRGLEQGLYHVLAERAREIAGKKKLETKSFAVELRVDGTLEDGDVRVQHSWEEASSGNTKVLARQRPAVKPAQNPVSPNHVNPFPASPQFHQPSSPAFQSPASAAPVTPLAQAEEMTAVNPRRSALFMIEIWKGGVRQQVLPVFQSQVVVGRGSKSKPVDVMLQGDPEISRRHLLVVRDRTGGYSVINEGKNPAMINGKELPIGQRVTISAGQPVMVCSYMIRIQP